MHRPHSIFSIFSIQVFPSMSLNTREMFYYVNTLIPTMTMKQLNCKTEPRTMKELKVILKQRASFEMLTSFTVLPYMLRSHTKIDLNDIISTGTFIYAKNESFKQLMIKRLPLYDE